MDNKKELIIGIVAVAIVAILVFLGGWVSNKPASEPINQFSLGLTKGESNLRQVSESDHIKGNINAPVKIVIYSDTECPFCKQFHFVVTKLAKEYGANKLAIVYRHFPLDGLHQKSRLEAAATECAAEIGGNDKFWLYLDTIYANTPANDGLDSSLLPTFASQVGLNAGAFKSCLDSNKYAEKIQASIDEAQALGAQGTPYPIIIDPKGKATALKGYVSYEKLKPMIDQALGN